jgi:elongation factor G
LKDAAANGRVSLLEPVDEVAVRLPDEHLGTVLGDLSSRRGRVLGTEADGTPGYSVVRAEVPATSLLRYAIDLRSMTSGSATFTRTFSRYDPLPESLAAQVT